MNFKKDYVGEPDPDDVHDEMREDAVSVLKEEFNQFIKDKAKRKGYYYNSEDKIRSHLRDIMLICSVCEKVAYEIAIEKDEEELTRLKKALDEEEEDIVWQGIE